MHIRSLHTCSVHYYNVQQLLQSHAHMLDSIVHVLRIVYVYVYVHVCIRALHAQWQC